MGIPIPCTHAYDNPAVQRCCEARNLMIHRNQTETDEEGVERVMSAEPGIRQNIELMKAIHKMQEMDPSSAYQQAMPTPVGREAIQDYIACVLHGVSIGAIDSEVSPRLLYGAQVALSAIPKIVFRQPNSRF